MSSIVDPNFEIIRRLDQSAVKLFEYCFRAQILRNEGEKWLKTGIEGPLFLYEKSTEVEEERRYALLVGHSSKNCFTLPITNQLQVERGSANYVFIRSVEQGTTRVHGIWVFGQECSKKFFDALMRLVNEQKQCIMSASNSTTGDTVFSNGITAVNAPNGTTMSSNGITTAGASICTNGDTMIPNGITTAGASICTKGDDTDESAAKELDNDTVVVNNNNAEPGVAASDGIDSLDEVSPYDEFDFYDHERKFSDECYANNGVAIVVRKRADFVLFYLCELGDLCVLLRRHTNVQSVAEFDAMFSLAEFYNVSFVNVAEQKAMGQSAIKWMCTSDEVTLNNNDWKDSRVLRGGFVQVSVYFNFVDKPILKCSDDQLIVVTDDFGKVLVDKEFMKDEALFDKSVVLWVTFVKEFEECHWKIFPEDNYEAAAAADDAQHLVHGYDDQHTETTLSTVEKQEMDGQEGEDEVLPCLTPSDCEQLLSPQSLATTAPAFDSSTERSPATPFLLSSSTVCTANDQHLIRPVTYGDLRTQTEELARMKEEMEATVAQLKEEMLEGFRRLYAMMDKAGGHNNANQ